TRSPAPLRAYSRSVSARSSGGRWSCSATRTPLAKASEPPCTSVSPASIRSSVVLPAPFGPASARRSRRSTLNETPSKSTAPESSLRRLVAIRTAMPPRIQASDGGSPRGDRLGSMRIAVAFDHRGVNLREAVLEALEDHEVVDLGTHTDAVRID